MTGASPWKQHFIQVAECNAWAYKVLLESVAQLSDEQFSAHAGLCFRSIHGTLNHLVLSEQFWYARFTGDSSTPSPEVTALWTSENMYSKPGDASSIWEEYNPDRSKIIEAIEKSISAAITQFGLRPPTMDYVGAPGITRNV
ncbi:hypothetical protein SYNPS1DRAFT_26554 [Syncephalis pseudoplumigaleata]|uniref:DinB-like domain-containing protein n=1 Tax=Syncephalis pseudoplumigaleata TaxID=1712513 RepID=A0A4P9Z6L0_9FUNG|nr:hypothetical protein SYNPS1DRAFT_26554 [Syncephalis pseudoplumigaleata]|eukprot:RKP27802.1 hypothetical protein SYNPS1DRAFT_26554 [Syncephalis pseudoplumigaleata]